MKVLPQETPLVPESEELAVPESVDARVRGRAASLWGVAWKALAWALLGSLVLESSMRAFGGGSLHPGAAGLGVLLVWALVLALVGLTGSPRRAHVLSAVVVVLLAVINVARMKILVTPLVPGDVVFLRSPMFLVNMVGIVPVMLCVVVGAALLVAVVRVCARRGWGEVPASLRGTRTWHAVRLLLVAQGVVVGLLCASFNTPGNVVRAAYDGVGAAWMPWSQKSNYLYNGFVGGVLYNLPVDPMERPAGYGRGRLERLAATWEERAVGAGGAALDANVVVVLSESLGDVDRLTSVDAERDPLAALRPVIENNWHGELVANYGTGTSSMEFQVLTGQNAALFEPQITSPFQQFVAAQDPYPSAVRWLDSLGRSSVAVHPYTTEMYDRTNVYPALGVDRFVHEAEFEGAERNRPDGFITDAEAYAKVIAELRDTTAPATVHLVTMQNHLPYGSDDDAVAVRGVGKGERTAVSSWLAGVERTAEATVQFLDELADLDEPSVVVFFGDHFPGIFPQATVDAEQERMYRTPYLIWASPDIAPTESSDGSGNAQQSRDLGVTSPTALLPLALERAGVRRPPMAMFLETFRTEVGALSGDDVVRPDGTTVARADLTSDQQRLVEEYRLLQYDMSVGERWVADRMWATP